MTESRNIYFKALLFVTIVVPASTYLHRENRPYTFPDDFKTCKAESSDPSCLVDLIQDALNKLGTRGISSPINFTINTMTIDSWNFHVEVDAVKTQEYFWGISHPNLWNATVLSATFDPTNLVLTYTTFHDHIIQYNDHYKMWGQLYYDEDSSPEVVYGNGTVDKHLHDVTLEHMVVFYPATIGDTDYLYVSSYDLSVLGFSDVILNYHNLYGGDEKLGKRAGDLMNENAKKILLQQNDRFTEMLIYMFKLNIQTLVSSVPASALLAHLSG